MIPSRTLLRRTASARLINPPSPAGPAITAKLRVAQLSAAELAAHAAATPSSAAAAAAAKSKASSTTASGPTDGVFTLMLRIPAWARDGGVLLELNGQAFNGCPGAPLPDSYCRITRWVGAGGGGRGAEASGGRLGSWAARNVASCCLGPSLATAVVF